MSKIPKVNIVIVAGDTWSDTFEFYQNDAPLDMEGAELVVQFRPMEALYGTTDEETLLLELNIGSGIEWTEPHVATMTMSVQDTQKLNPENTAVNVVAWGLQLDNQVITKMQMQGSAQVLGKVVR